MKVLKAILLGGGLFMLQQGQYIPNTQPFMPHQPMPMMQPAKSHLDVYRENIQSAEKSAVQFRQTAEGRATDQPED